MYVFIKLKKPVIIFYEENSMTTLQGKS